MTTSTALASGTRIGGYEVVEPLQRGGMATLFLARKTGAAGFSRYVAIKVVHEELAVDPTFVELFLDEARLSAQISHPNVVHVEDLGEQEGLYYLVMEYVHGCSLSDLMLQMNEDGRRPTPQLACHIALKLCEGLHAAHEARGPRGDPLGIVHRDVSPQNILLSRAGDVKLIDFGIAKATGTSGQGLVGAGKLAYMPPEQAAGEPVDRRADIYAVGVLLWEMLTMRRLFTGRTPESLRDKVLHPNPKPPSDFAEALPEGLDALVLRALSPGKDERPTTAGELSRAIAQVVPEAASLQPSQLALLLDDLMGEPLESSERRLPQELTRSAPRMIGQSTATTALTIAVDIPTQWTSVDAEGRVSSEGTAALTPTPIVAMPERTATAPFEVSADSIDPPVVASAEPPRRGAPAWLAAGLGAAVALTVAGGVFFALQPAAPEAPPPVDTAAVETAAVEEEPTPPEEPAVAEPIEEPIVEEPIVEARDEPVGEPEPEAAPTPRPRRRARRRRRRAPAAATEPSSEQRRIDGVVIVSDYGD